MNNSPENKKGIVKKVLNSKAVRGAGALTVGGLAVISGAHAAGADTPKPSVPIEYDSGAGGPGKHVDTVETTTTTTPEADVPIGIPPGETHEPVSTTPVTIPPVTIPPEAGGNDAYVNPGNNESTTTTTEPVTTSTAVVSPPVSERMPTTGSNSLPLEAAAGVAIGTGLAFGAEERIKRRQISQNAQQAALGIKNPNQ